MGPTFFEVSLVDADIKSQWQAHFLQIFPIESVMSKLPRTHVSDKELFIKEWRGAASVTYEQFMKDHYKGW